MVGRIAAIVDEAYAARWEPETALFGFFECTRDAEAARALLDVAEQALCARGVRRVMGPVNLTTHDETGILVRGFDSRPMVLSPYNPPYYDAFLEAAGYAPYREYHAYLGTPDARPATAVERLVRSLGAGRGIARGCAIRPLDLGRWDAEIRTVFELYNASFDDVWGFVPISWEEFRQRAERFRLFVKPELAPIAEVDGAPAGFAVTLPDANEALALWAADCGRSAGCGCCGVSHGSVPRGSSCWAYALSTGHAGWGRCSPSRRCAPCKGSDWSELSCRLSRPRTPGYAALSRHSVARW